MAKKKSNPPEKQASPPEKKSSPPEKQPGPPEKQASPPETQSSPPEKQASPPEKQAGPPEKQASPPEKQASPPEKQASPPEKQASPPEKQPGPPEKQASPPEKQPGPPEKQASPPEKQASPPEKQASPPKKEVIIVAVLVVSAAVLLFILSRQPAPPSPPPPPPVASRPPVTPGPMASGMPSPAMRPSPRPKGSAVAGTLIPSEILRGVAQLEKTDHPLTPEQAAVLVSVFENNDPRIEKVYAVNAAIDGSLTPAQKQYLTKRYNEMIDPKSGNRKYNPPGQGEVTAFHTRLESRLGGTTRASFGTVSSGQPSKPFMSDLLVQFGNDMESEPSLRLTTEQVRQLEPQYQAYQSLPNSFERCVLDPLTPEQKAAIDKAVTGSSGEAPAPDVDVPELLKRLKAKKK